MGETTEGTHRIDGRVVDAPDRGVAGLRVEAWDDDLVVDDLVGSATTDAAGRFRIEFSRRHFSELFLDRRPDLYFRVYAGDRLVADTHGAVTWNARAGATAIEIRVPLGTSGAGDRNDRGDDAYTIAGAVTIGRRPAPAGLRVDILERGIGADVLLAATRTDTRGAYRARFDAALLAARGATRPDLQSRVYADATFLAASEVRYDAARDETLDVALPADAAAAAQSEWESLTAAVAALHRGRLDELEESAERQDITYLASKTGWDARAVALAALAERFGRGAPTDDAGPIHPALYYALFRAGLPANAGALYRAPRDVVRGMWAAAIVQRVIPAMSDATLDAAATAFARTGARSALTVPAVAGGSPLGDLLRVSRLDAGQQQRFVALYSEHAHDLAAFWREVGGAFGADAGERLQLDGRLAFLTLDNAPLMRALHDAQGDLPLRDTADLARRGYHHADRWRALLGDDAVAIPAGIPGEGDARRQRYAEFLAAQVRLSHPTASVAHLVGSGAVKVGEAPNVRAFLDAHDDFEIGVTPVRAYVARSGADVAASTIAEVARLQRVYQITRDDTAMAGLLNAGVDAAAQIAVVDRAQFVATFAERVGGAGAAARIHERAVQVHNAVLNVAVAYLTARNGVALGTRALGAGDGGTVLQPAPTGASGGATGVLAYATLEELFGEMDYCGCDHCRSILSPAAYLVDLLHFIDRAPAVAGTRNPQQVLLERRPDIQHLPLTCENTNVALPYIDVVNETLEYLVANAATPLSLQGYEGHDTGAATSADLLAQPQYVASTAYDRLRAARFPIPLPFHQPLERLRRYFDTLGVPLPLAMERLRAHDALERGTAAYGWRDILLEELRLTRAEHEILCDAAAVPLAALYGFPAGTTPAAAIAALSNARNLARRLGISYDDVAALLRARFVNPNADLRPRLRRLGVDFATLGALQDGTLTAAQFAARLPTGTLAPDPAAYGGDIAAWVTDPANAGRIMGIITLADPSGGGDACDFSTVELRYARPTAVGDTSTRLGAAEFVRLLRFTRLWKALGWTIEQTDAALCALFPVPPFGANAVATLTALDAGFRALLPRLGVVARVMRALDLAPGRDLASVLALWAPLDVRGEGGLYRQLFLGAASPTRDPAFADDGFGAVLQDATQTLVGHAETLRAAFGMTSEELAGTFAALGIVATTRLTLDAVSAVYRRAWLARALKVSVRELLLLVRATGLDPFAAPDPTDPAVLRLVALVRAMQARALPTSAALYLVWNHDLSGRAAPADATVDALVRALRADFAAIDDQLAITEDPGGDAVRARLTLVYGSDTADAFVALLDDTLTLDVPYTHGTASLEAEITAAAPALAYDPFRHRLAHTGLLGAATATTLAALPTATSAFAAAARALVDRGADTLGSFFARVPELRPLYEAYVASMQPPAVRRRALLDAFRPELARRRKRQQALQRVAAELDLDLAEARALLDPPAAPFPMHAAGRVDRPALDDLLAAETPGLAVEFHHADTLAGAPALTVAAEPTLAYSAGGSHALPANPVAGAAISATWRGRLEAPESGYYNIVVEADAGATVTLSLGGRPRALTRTGTTWRNTDPLELAAGTLHDIRVTVERVRDTVAVRWETPTRPREVVPARHLYPPSLFASFRAAYVRLLKAASLAEALRLTADELAHFATDADYRIDGDGWLHALPVTGAATSGVAAALRRPFEGLLDYARIKAECAPDDGALLGALRDPETPALFAVTRWDPASLDAWLAHAGGNRAGLRRFDRFRRAYDALALARTMGIGAGPLVAATTNEPTGDTVRALDAALRARYDAADWRAVVRPINDALRSRQRDALAAHVLHGLRGDPARAHVDTPDKLFEYLLTDVQMEPCMQTSRVRHALSSVQLFVERCLMNLEPAVSPASIDAARWEWMKRYRVWEANRKVFLFPENWLEPELRDDKSPFFAELESELLQGDVTEDAAAAALQGYLAKLEEVAQLEPCAIHHVAGDTQRITDDVQHVVARTSGARRKYYYRRREFGAWTPWEQIKLDIEGDPVTPVVWKGRLLLFWLRIMKQPPLDPRTMSVSSATGSLASQTPSALQADARSTAASNAQVQLSAVLCWSERHNGAWLPVKTSDIERPTSLNAVTSLAQFDRSRLILWTHEEGDRHHLRVVVYGSVVASFYLYTTHGAPVRQEDAPPIAYPTLAASRSPLTHGGTFDVEYFSYSVVAEMVARHTVLGTTLADSVITPRHAVPDVETWRTPFFYRDPLHVFWVTSSIEPATVAIQPGYGVILGQPPAVRIADYRIPGLVYEVRTPRTPKPPRPGDPDDPTPEVRTSGLDAVIRFAGANARVDTLIGSAAAVRYDNAVVGPFGALHADARPAGSPTLVG